MTLAQLFGCVDSPVPSERSDTPDETDVESVVLDEESATPNTPDEGMEAPEVEPGAPEEESESSEKQSSDELDEDSIIWGSTEYEDAAALSDSDDDYDGGQTADHKPAQSSRTTRSQASLAEAVVLGSEDDADDGDEDSISTNEEEQGDRVNELARARRVVLDSEDEALSEVAWSESELEDGDYSVQPTGEHLLVICRNSSGKDGDLTKQRRNAESLDMGERLKANCHDPTAVDFQTEEAIFFVKQSHLGSSFTKPSDNAYTRPLRLWLDAHKNSTSTVLIRSIDGLTTNSETMKSTLVALHERGITAQLIFQFNKVCDEIRPIKLIPFKGLGSVTVVHSTTFLAHLEKSINEPVVARIIEIWSDLNTNKVEGQGIQDRNEVPPKDIQRAEEVMGISRSYGRAGQPLKAKTHPSASKSGRIKVAERFETWR